MGVGLLHNGYEHFFWGGGVLLFFRREGGGGANSGVWHTDVWYGVDF